MDLTTCIYTHYTDKVVKNRDLAPPGVKLLRGTLEAAKRWTPEIFESPVILFYDSPRRERTYREGLEALALEFKIDFVVREHGSYRRMILEAFRSHVHTKYCFHLEHDWWFIQRLKVRELLESMDQHDFIQYVKLMNYHDDSERFRPGSGEYFCFFSNDHLAGFDPRLEDHTLIADTLWSSNPHFARTAKYKHEWIPQLQACSLDDASNGGAGGVEEALSYAAHRDYSNLPFWEANAKWGLYLKAANHRYIEHMGV